MGRQILFHMLPEDCESFLSFARERDPVAIVESSAGSPQVVPITNPCSPGKSLSLWNQRLLPSLERKYVPKSTKGPYYRVDDSLPVLEFFLPRQEEWDGQPALTQGRIYASFDQPNEDLRRWFDTLARWIRTNFTKNTVPSFSGYVGPAALEWHRSGGLLLPMIRPPVTPEWRAVVQLQSGRKRIGH
jgi:hypothetical protein